MIVLCGGIRKFTTDLNIGFAAVSLWQRRGIPRKHWPRMIELSGQKIELEHLVAYTDQVKSKKVDKLA